MIAQRWEATKACVGEEVNFITVILQSMAMNVPHPSVLLRYMYIHSTFSKEN